MSKNQIEILINKNEKYLSKMSFKEKALYSILMDCTDPIDLVENVFNPLIQNQKIDDTTIDMYCLKHLYRDKKARIELFKNVVDIIERSPKLSKNSYIYICVDKKYGEDLKPNKIAKELGNLFLPISDQLKNQLVCVDIDEIAKRSFSKCLIFKINLSKGLQLLPIRYNIDDIEYHSLIIPPIYKWKHDGYTNLKDELMKNKDSKLTLVEQLRLINKFTNIPLLEFTVN